MNLCTRKGLSISQIPPGGVGAQVADAPNRGDPEPAQTTKDIEQFLTEAVNEAVPFIDGVAPKSGGNTTWKSKGNPKAFKESDAPVYSSEKTVSIKSSSGTTNHSKEGKETWFSRRSCHRNSTERGTASWDEFRRAFFEHHAEIESKYVPTVIGVRRAMRWNTEGVEIILNGDKWVEFSLEIWEMKHRIDPKPLHNRTFTTLQITARIEGVQEFIMIQIPIPDFGKSPYSEFARDKQLVVGAYTSVERVRIIPQTAEIEWIMATASDAGGNLPQFVQNMAVPSELTKDVQKFLSWIPSQR